MNLFNKYALVCAFAMLTACDSGKKEKAKDLPTENKTVTEKEDKAEDKQEQASSDVEEAQTNALKTIKGYFESLTAGKYEVASDNFSKKVVQWITIKNTTPQAIAKEAKRFLSSKKEVKYTVDEESFRMFGNSASVQVRQQWTGYEANVEVEISFDKAYKMFSYIERKAVFKKQKSTPVAGLEALLKKLPKKSLPFDMNTEEGFTDMSNLCMKVLIGNAEDIKFMKEGMGSGIIRAYECFWYPISEDVVGIVTGNGGRIVMFSLSTFNRKTGEKIDDESIGNAGGMMQMRETAQINFKKDLTIEANTEILEPDLDGNEEFKVTEKKTYYYTVSKGGGIKK